MTTITKLALAAGLGFTMIAHAQVNPQPQPQNPQSTAAPCSPAGLPQAPNAPPNAASRIHFNPFAAKSGILGKTVKEITDKTGVSVSPPTPEVKKVAPPKPCPVTSIPAQPPEPKTVLLCPPNTTSVPNQPYCLKGNNTLVDAIKVTMPPDVKPNPPAPAAPATAQQR